MKRFPFYITAAVLTAFGMLTVFLTSSIILDLFGVREREGNYVLLIVWANLISGILFLTAAFGLMKRKHWAAKPLIVSLAVLVFAFLGLLIHIQSGGAYETKTVGAMIFRLTVNGILALVVYRATKKQKTSTLIKSGVLMLLPLAFLVAGCGHATEKGHDHHEAEEAHHHADEQENAVTLNNGDKWEADAHTVSVVSEMRKELSDFERSGQGNYKVLGDSLTHQLNVLIKGCTMKGPAHDELHKWLVPLTQQVKDLSTANDSGEGAATVTEIEKSLEVFDESFQ